MSQEQISGSGKTLKRLQRQTIKPRGKSKQTKLSNSKGLAYSNKIISSHQPLWFWNRHYHWSFWQRLLFWSGLIGCTAFLSVGFGAALTKIDRVENAIAQKIKVNSSQQPVLHRPINVLLIEVESKADDIVEFSQSFKGHTKTVLLLKFNPQTSRTEAINIPTDSQVEIPGFGQGTIDDAHRYGGTSLVARLVSQMLAGQNVDRYIRATPQTFQQLTASGKLALHRCNSRINDCEQKAAQIIRQENMLETIRQRLNIPVYLKEFQTKLTELKPAFDTDASISELMAIANFVKEVNPGAMSVDLVPGYISHMAIDAPAQNSQQSKKSNLVVNPKQPFLTAKSASAPPLKTIAPAPKKREHPFHHRPIAVQNTTESPELAMRVVKYLRRQNFQDVYLVEHIPLKLKQTKIVVNHSQLKTANYLKGRLGFGSLEPSPTSQTRKLTIQIGEDAHYLPLDNQAADNYADDF